MRYLITGGKGFIGTNLIIYLKSIGHEVKLLDIDPRDDPSCTYSDISTGMPDIEADILVHLAAYTNIRNSLIDPSKTALVNVVGTTRALDLAKKYNYKKFVFASSGGAPKSKSPYSASKYAAEMLCKAYRLSYDMDVTVLRLANVYGPHSLHKNSIIPKAIKLILDNKPIRIFGDGKQTRDFVHVDDVTESVANICTEQNFLIATGRSVTINKLIKMLNALSKKYLNRKVKVIHTDAIKGEILKVDLPATIFPCVELEDGLESTFNWFMRNYEFRH